MKKSDTMNMLVSLFLFLLASFFSISLLGYFWGSSGEQHELQDIIWSLGYILVSVYGFCSILIPVFLLVTAFFCFSSAWTVKKGLSLLLSIIPFFTIVLTERMCRLVAAVEKGPLFMIKMVTALILCALLVGIEYLFIGIIADKLVIHDFLKLRKKIKLPDRKSFTEGNSEDIRESGTTGDISEQPEPGTGLGIPVKENTGEQSSGQDKIPDQDQAEITVSDRMEPDETEPDMAAGTESDSAPENKTDGNESFEPDFFDIDMNAEDEEELAAKEALNDEDELNDSENYTGIANVFAQMDADVRREVDEDDMIEPVCQLPVAEAAETAVEPEVLHPSVAAPDPAEKGSDLNTASDEDKEPGLEPVPYTRTEDDTEEPEKNEEHIQESRIEIKPPRKLFRGLYKVPTEGLLTAYADEPYWIIDTETKNASVQLKETLSEFKIEADVTGIRKGPVVTMFEILPAPGVKLSKIVALQDNIALRLAASSVRIVAPIPGKRAVGIEVPNKERAIVSFREIVEQDLPAFKKMAVPVILGKDIQGESQIIDLVKTPHLLIAGATGSGKSVCVNSMILSILYKRSPNEVKLILIDPKIVELKLYNDIPHLLTPVITEPKRAFQALQYCLCEMERRYALLDSMGVRDIMSYNRRITERHIATERLPYIVVIIDEFADLMATTGKELESTVARLAAMSRAIGIHIVLATQRPSIDVITGLIKANIPSRIAFMVASKMDSRIIIDQVGAEKLLGRGDMLYASSTDPFPVRIQGTFVSDSEVENVVDYVKQLGEPDYIDDEIFIDDEEEPDQPELFDEGEDPLYSQALDIVIQAGKASASYIQRRLKIGYNRAARLVEDMETRGIVGPANGSKPREIIHVP